MDSIGIDPIEVLAEKLYCQSARVPFDFLIEDDILDHEEVFILNCFALATKFHDVYEKIRPKPITENQEALLNRALEHAKNAIARAKEKDIFGELLKEDA